MFSKERYCDDGQIFNFGASEISKNAKLVDAVNWLKINNSEIYVDSKQMLMLLMKLRESMQNEFISILPPEMTFQEFVAFDE